LTAPTIMWFRRDLRLADNEALLAACADGPVVPLFVLDDESPTHGYAMGAAQRWWLHKSLEKLDKSLSGNLVLRRGNANHMVLAVSQETGAKAVHATRLYEPWERDVEQALGDKLVLHNGDTLVPPEQVTTGSGTPFKVYGAFWSALTGHLPPPEPLPPPERITYADKPTSDDLDDWQLLPTNPDWSTGFGKEWSPGEDGAAERLDHFVGEVGDYLSRRDFPSIEGTSRLSPHLHFGEVSARQVWQTLDRSGGAKYLKELAWRDFARQAMLSQPDIGWTTGRSKMRSLPYRTGKAAESDFIAWTKGLTGYPIVDAGMRQLWTTGWMHNRVRMIAASFLTKHLLIDWRRGARWFWDCLVDADYGNNSLNWQWVAGTGTASQMFTRIMAPITQSEKFDAADYIREWVPELAHIGDADIHDPPDLLRDRYPIKVIGHREGRERALAALGDGRSADH
jgi:deoxyribodipyrimidine photo-lyase